MTPPKQLSSDQKGWIYIAYNEFRDNGRPLGRDEMMKITNMMLKPDTIHHNVLISLLNSFRNPEDKTTIRYRKNTRGHEKDLLADVERIFTTYRREDEDAEDRCINLKGFTRRLPVIYLHHKPKWNHKHTRSDQLFLIYALVNFCIGDHDIDLIYDVLEKKIFHAPRLGRCKFVQNLRDKDEEITKQVAKTMGQDRLYREFFEERAHAMFKEYELAAKVEVPNLVIPSQPDETNVEAGTSYDINEDFDFDLYESEQTGGSAELSAASDEEAKGKGKGKGKQRRERDSNPNSPSKGKLGSPEVKKPRREGKS